MKNINSFIRENIKCISEKNILLAPDIQEKKLNNAVKSFCFSGNPDSVIAIFDNTILGSAKDGILFTGERFIYRPTFSDPISITYHDIKSAIYTEVASGKDGNKTTKLVNITMKDDRVISIKDLIDCDYERLASTLQSCASDFEEYKEERQLIPVEEMSYLLKVSYVKVIINMAFAGDGVIDEKEFAEILLLMTRLDLSPDSRFELRSYLSSGESLLSMESLLDTINKECPEGQVKSVHISLAKDLINTYLSTGGASLTNFQFFNENRHLLDISDGDIELIIMAIETDHEMLKPEYTDDHLVSAMKLMSAKAAAVGTPLAAVYLTGSVVGLSAAGITSGLATLGMGGLLGMSSMVTGIGVVVLIGLGAYTGVRKLTSVDEITKSRRRELMLNEVIKQTQITISLLVQDINFIVSKLNGVLATKDQQEAQVKKLMCLMKQITSAGGVLTGRASSAQNSAIRIKCARHLNLMRLQSLTREPTKAALYDFIVGFYEEKIEPSEKDGSESKVLALKQDSDNGSMEKLAKAFEAIGYFDAGEVAKGAAVDMTMKAKDKLVGLFS